ncbi:MAG: hypothetical protein HY584_01630, partial [Candidatus Omnitrophica bacterium]|nr:hypothetical protein [Candidatus Omnitrophota bacterium]
MRKINSFSFQAAIQPGLVIRWFLRIAGILLVCHLLALTFFDWSWQWERLFSLDFENNLPTWFSSFLWLTAALFAYGCAQQILNVRRRLLWNVSALFFIFLSCDEVASIHEHVGSLLNAFVFQTSIHAIRDMRDWPFFLGPIAIIFCTWIGYQLRDK